MGYWGWPKGRAKRHCIWHHFARLFGLGLDLKLAFDLQMVLNDIGSWKPAQEATETWNVIVMWNKLCQNG